MAMKRFILRNIKSQWSTIHQSSFYNSQTLYVSVHRFSSEQQSTPAPATFAERYATRCKATGKLKLFTGDYATAEKTFTSSDVQTYTQITGDDNPVHSITSNEAAQEAGFDASICHGMFSATLFSAAIGSALPGAILIEKTIKWKRPLYLNESLYARVEVTKILPRRKIVVCDMSAKNQDDEVAIDGKLTFLVRDLDV
eukprot:328526_1